MNWTELNWVLLCDDRKHRIMSPTRLVIRTPSGQRTAWLGRSPTVPGGDPARLPRGLSRRTQIHVQISPVRHQNAPMPTQCRWQGHATQRFIRCSHSHGIPWESMSPTQWFVYPLSVSLTAHVSCVPLPKLDTSALLNQNFRIAMN